MSNGPIQRTRTVPLNGNQEGKNVGFSGGNGPAFDNTPIGNKHQRVEAISEEDEPQTNKGKQEPLMLSIEHYITIVGMFNRFKTKQTVWYDSPEAEKKRDSNRLVQFKLRGNKITAVYDDETTRDVLATEIDVATRFASIFNATEAARLYELTDSGLPLHDAVLKVINDTQEVGAELGDTQPLQRTMSVGGGA
jgi:hypothetical protein